MEYHTLNFRLEFNLDCFFGFLGSVKERAIFKTDIPASKFAGSDLIV